MADAPQRASVPVTYNESFNMDSYGYRTSYNGNNTNLRMSTSSYDGRASAPATYTSVVVTDSVANSSSLNLSRSSVQMDAGSRFVEERWSSAKTWEREQTEYVGRSGQKYTRYAAWVCMCSSTQNTSGLDCVYTYPCT